ncbi:transposase protein domain-containing protein [Phthorimaea operculella]|nr:transposase protein domain-containing protein [Phthorimaea operculella]
MAVVTQPCQRPATCSRRTIDQQRLLRPIENIMDRRTSSQVPGTLYDVDMDEQHRYLRSIENITSEESSSKAKPVARCDVTLQYDPQIAKDNILTKTNLELASVTQLAESTTVTEAITKQSIYCRVSTESTTKPDHLDTADLQQQKTAGSGTEMEKKEPKGIQISEKIFILPSPQTLLRVLSMANIRPGINKNTMAQIKKATEKMTVEDRLCIVLFDEMSLKPNVTYNDRKDRVTGFVTNGEDTKPEFADHAQVFMTRILPSECKETADVLLFFDNLFDSVNGSFEKNKHAKPLLGPATPTSCHKKVWEESKTMLREMKFLNPKKNTIEHVPTLKNWVWTLEGIELLLKKLKTDYKITSVWLRHLNQDPIENFFGAIRSHGCRNVNPTPDKFESAFTTLLVNSLSSVHAPGANCEVDPCNALHEVIITAKDCNYNNDCNLQNIPDVTITPLEEKNDPRQIAGLQYTLVKFINNPVLEFMKANFNLIIHQ